MKKKDNKIVGPLIIPNRKILINNEYYVYFKEPIIKKLQDDFFNKSDESFLKSKIDLNKYKLIESWIIEDIDNDKSKLYGYTELPKGTWFVVYEKKKKRQEKLKKLLDEQ